jgi:hypothetical protein
MKISKNEEVRIIGALWSIAGCAVTGAISGTLISNRINSWTDKKIQETSYYSLQAITTELQTMAFFLDMGGGGLCLYYLGGSSTSPRIKHIITAALASLLTSAATMTLYPRRITSSPKDPN